MLPLSVTLACWPPTPPLGSGEGLPWVDPTRCLEPCAGPDPSHLVTIDERGQFASGPFRIDRQVQPALASLVTEAAATGHWLRVLSAHRHHAEQERFFAVEPEVGRFARPGHSEHELGLAVDLDYDDASLEFLRRRGPAYGFVTSYPAGREHRTGFRSEPWHQRHVGAPLAAELTARGLTLQEYLEANPTRGRWGACSGCRSPLARASCDTPVARCDGDVLRWCMPGDASEHEAPAAVGCRASDSCCDPSHGRCGPCSSPRAP